MTGGELAEKNGLTRMATEYKRVVKILAGTGFLSYDECMNIALRVCNSRGVFDGWPMTDEERRRRL